MIRKCRIGNETEAIAVQRIFEQYAKDKKIEEEDILSVIQIIYWFVSMIMLFRPDLFIIKLTIFSKFSSNKLLEIKSCMYFSLHVKKKMKFL